LSKVLKMFHKTHHFGLRLHSCQRQFKIIPITSLKLYQSG
jgi:hypothetical protein